MFHPEFPQPSPTFPGVDPHHPFMLKTHKQVMKPHAPMKTIAHVKPVMKPHAPMKPAMPAKPVMQPHTPIKPIKPIMKPEMPMKPVKPIMKPADINNAKINTAPQKVNVPVKIDPHIMNAKATVKNVDIMPVKPMPPTNNVTTNGFDLNLSGGCSNGVVVVPGQVTDNLNCGGQVQIHMNW